MARCNGYVASASALFGLMVVATPSAHAQAEPIFLTVPAGPAGIHLEFTNTAGVGGFTSFTLFGAATHAGGLPPPAPPVLHTLVIVFEWRIAPGAVHDSTTWGESPDNITTVIGGVTNPFSTGVFITPGAWTTVALHLYCGFPISVSATFEHSWTLVPTPASIGLLGLAGLVATRRRR